MYVSIFVAVITTGFCYVCNEYAVSFYTHRCFACLLNTSFMFHFKFKIDAPVAAFLRKDAKVNEMHQIKTIFTAFLYA